MQTQTVTWISSNVGRVMKTFMSVCRLMESCLRERPWWCHQAERSLCVNVKKTECVWRLGPCVSSVFLKWPFECHNLPFSTENFLQNTQQVQQLVNIPQSLCFKWHFVPSGLSPTWSATRLRSIWTSWDLASTTRTYKPGWCWTASVSIRTLKAPIVFGNILIWLTSYR